MDMITVVGESISEQEKTADADYLEQKHKRKLKSLDIRIDGEYVDLSYTFEHVPFERIRRITGYLVGTTERWNSAKQEEEKDRKKHSVSVMEELT
jgi:hypothetical protein